MPRTTVLVIIDGLDPEYLEYCPASKLRDMAKHGFMVEGRAMIIEGTEEAVEAKISEPTVLHGNDRCGNIVCT